RMRGKTKLGLHALERLAGPVSMLAAVGASLALAVSQPGPIPQLLAVTHEVLLIAGGFWLAAGIIDVEGATGRESARQLAPPMAGGATVVGRYFDKMTLAVGAVTVLAVRLGASEQIYLLRTGLAAALAFGARDPIRNAVAFAAMVPDPPFHLGDQV